MARDSERLAADAFTRASVEAYLQAAAEQRARIELSIAEAERRRQRAVEALERLDELTPAAGDDPAPSVIEPPDAEAAPDAGSSSNGSGPGTAR
jgi:hypothetical protein